MNSRLYVKILDTQPLQKSGHYYLVVDKVKVVETKGIGYILWDPQDASNVEMPVSVNYVDSLANKSGITF